MMASTVDIIFSGILFLLSGLCAVSCAVIWIKDRRECRALSTKKKIAKASEADRACLANWQRLYEFTADQLDIAKTENKTLRKQLELSNAILAKSKVAEL